MRFFLVARDPDTGMVRLIKEGTYGNRQEALDVLGPAVDADPSLGASDLFLVDLDLIAPVVLYRPASTATPAGEPLADAWIAPSDEGESDSVVEEAVLEGPEPLWVPDETLTAPDADGGDLAGALRRAATRMESEGIVAPPSVEEFAALGTSEPPTADVPPEAETLQAETAPAPSEQGLLAGPEPWPWEADAPDGAADAPPVAEGLAVEVTVDAVPPLLPAEEAGIPVAPWESEPTTAADDAPDAQTDAAVDLEAALSLDVPMVEKLATPEPTPVFEPVGIDEPGLEEVQLLTPVEDITPRPLIIGEYAADPSTDDDDLTLAELEALAQSLEATSADVTPGADEAAVSDVVPETAISEPVEAPADDSPAEPGDEKVYEPGGLDIAAYTCDDCVYVVTCPKARQEGPATCGSFQWKSV